MNRLRTVLLVSLLWPSLGLGGCAIARQDSNEPLDAAAIQSLQPGTTTAREVTERLGAPTEVVQLGKRTAYRYDAVTTKSAFIIGILVFIGSQDTRSDRLWVFFDERDVLTHFGAAYGTHRTQYAMPWEDVHEAADNESRDAVRFGVGK